MNKRQKKKAFKKKCGVNPAEVVKAINKATKIVANAVNKLVSIVVKAIYAYQQMPEEDKRKLLEERKTGNEVK